MDVLVLFLLGRVGPLGEGARRRALWSLARGREMPSRCPAYVLLVAKAAWTRPGFGDGRSLLYVMRWRPRCVWRGGRTGVWWVSGWGSVRAGVYGAPGGRSAGGAALRSFPSVPRVCSRPNRVLRGPVQQVDFNSFSWHTLFLLGGGNVIGKAIRSSQLLDILARAIVEMLPKVTGASRF